MNVAGLIEFGLVPDPCPPFGKHHPRLGAMGTVRKFGMVRIRAFPLTVANGEKGQITRDTEGPGHVVEIALTPRGQEVVLSALHIHTPGHREALLELVARTY